MYHYFCFPLTFSGKYKNTAVTWKSVSLQFGLVEFMWADWVKFVWCKRTIKVKSVWAQKWAMPLRTSISCCRTHCLTHLVRYTRVDFAHYKLANIFAKLVNFSSTEDGHQLITTSVHLCQTKLTTLDVLWRNFLSPEFWTKFRREVALFLEIPKFP